MDFKGLSIPDIKNYINVSGLQRDESPESSYEQALRERLEELGINYDDYKKSTARSKRNSQEPPADLRLTVQDALHNLAKARDPEQPLSQILAGVADYFAPGAENRFDSTALLDHLQSEAIGVADSSKSHFAKSETLNNPDPEMYDKVAGDLADSLLKFSGSNFNGKHFGESLRAALKEANQAGLDSAQLVSKVMEVLKEAV
ncbi:hypothetical protein PseBG33_5141 [Pseudomonas synxantha BG33R]|uniref:hypothetical protein n=1 Tax=Pseudomonas TaxID=286 RepID=UPI00025FEDDB|nr:MULTISPECIES: hypothetical protein [Pseudomonas]EIK71639.1 hypothetical protein PseBG33_5141 [Pseudomonas synxantha BG33R]QOY71179.1 hypothetical protein IH404_26130 [Pseudomonas sp. OST1909]WPN54397.1 hypothetical protein QMK52_09640 [Pseudomonas sp. P9_2]